MLSNRQNSHSRRGFALVIALSMMAFVVLLIVSMSFLVSVETSASSTQLAQLKARESAKLSLYIALGELQKHAGPDSRVTARAEITGAGNGERYWTGVWDTNNPNNPPVWLVSGVNADPINPVLLKMELLGAGSVDLTGTALADQYVSAPTVEVTDANNSIRESIAWWISDEGVKASVGSLPLDSRPTPNFLDAAESEASELQVANLQGLEELFATYDRFEPAAINGQDLIQSLSDLNNVDGFQNAQGQLSYTANEAPVHSLAPASYGVLSNTLPAAEPDSGLMRDLSLYPRLLGDGLAEYLQLGETHEAELSGTGIGGLRLFTDIQGLDQLPALNDGDIALPITPVLSNFMIGFTIRQNAKTDPNLYLRMVFFCELWNPYSHTLEIVDSDGSAMDLQLEVTGLPVIDVEKSVYKIEADGTRRLISSTSSPVSLEDALGSPNHSDSALVIRLKNSDSEEWLPGRTKNWTGINGTDRESGQSPYNSTDTTTKNWNYNSHKLGHSIGIDTGVDIAIHAESDSSHDVLVRHVSSQLSEIEIGLSLFDPTSEVSKRIATYGKATYEPVSTMPPSSLGFDYKHKSITFGYHIVMREPHNSSNDSDYLRGRWLYDDDPRNPKPLFSADWQLNNDTDNTVGSPYLPVIDALSPLLVPTPESINQANSTINFPEKRRLIDRTSPLNAIWQDAPLFELPRQRVLSLASLQHVYFHNERPFQIGNSWGSNGSTNSSAWFDRYYFSGFSRADDSNTLNRAAGPPNPALLNYSAVTSDTLSDWQANGPSDSDAALKPAEGLMVANRFNLNSTSSAAWQAVLGSLRLNGWEYLDYSNDDTSDLTSLQVSSTNRGAMFSRFSHSLSETYDTVETPVFDDYNNPIAPSAFYRHGARRLSEDQVEALADKIVQLLQQKGRPFMDMEEFVSADSTGSSLLEQAIETVFTENGRQKWYHDWELEGAETALTGQSIDIDHFSPGFLTQADILTAIGPMLATRSDTFKIRTRSETFTQLGDVNGGAALEAIVQRIPDELDTGATSNPFGRKFKLLSVRWLDQAEL